MSRSEIRSLKLFEVSHVDHPANRESRVALWKRDQTKGGDGMDPEELAKKLAEMEKNLSTANDNNAELEKRLDSLVKSAEEAGFSVEGDKISKRSEEEFVEVDGEKIAKSAIPAPVLAKLAKADAEAAELRKKAEEADLLKRANDVVPNMVGGDDAKIQLVKMLDGVADESVRKAMTDALKAADEVLKAKTKEVGSDDGNGGASDDDAKALDDMVAKHATENKISKSAAYSAVLKTAEGRKLAASAMTRKAK